MRIPSTDRELGHRATGRAHSRNTEGLNCNMRFFRLFKGQVPPKQRAVLHNGHTTIAQSTSQMPQRRVGARTVDRHTLLTVKLRLDRCLANSHSLQLTVPACHTLQDMANIFDRRTGQRIPEISEFPLLPRTRPKLVLECKGSLALQKALFRFLPH